MELTLELQSDGKNVCAPGPYIKADGAGQALSTTIEISDVEAKADLQTLDSGILESINKALAAGTGLNMPLRNWSQAMCPISATGGAFSQHIMPAYPKLQAAFITFRPTLVDVAHTSL